MKKILIVGVSGFIGKELYENLSKDYTVFGISRSEVDLLNCEIVDVLNRKQLLGYFAKHDFNVVISLAAILADSNNLQDTKVLFDNLRITTNLIEALKTKKGVHLLNFSSSSVYSNLSGTYDEKSLIKPSDNSDCIYGLSKFNSEMLFDYLLENQPTELTQIRIPMVYGDKMNSERIHKVFEKELLETNSISVWGNGERVISQIYINDLVNKVKDVLQRKLYGTFNLTGESISIFDLAQKVVKEKGNSESTIKKINKGSKAKFVLDATLLNNLLDD